MSLFEGLGANEGLLGDMEMREGRGMGRQDCRDCGVRDAVIPSSPIAIPETPFVPPKIPGGPPIVIVDEGPRMAPVLPPPPPPPSPIHVDPPFAPIPIVEPRPEPTPRLPAVTNGDIYPTVPPPMIAPPGAKRRLPCC